MSHSEPTVPDGHCQCGCGALAPIAKLTRRGYRKGEPMRFVQGHHLRVAEYKANLYTDERNAKISDAHADGRIPNPEHKRGSAHHAWRGDDIEYAGMHSRLLSHRGPASGYLCSSCGLNAREWALNHAHPSARFDQSKPFSTDFYAYEPLCVSCHRRADRNGGYRCPILS